MMHIPPVMYLVQANFGFGFGIGNADDPVMTLDDAADAIAECHKAHGDIPVRVLRLTDTLNCDDVTADAFAVIAGRMLGVAAE